MKKLLRCFALLCVTALMLAVPYRLFIGPIRLDALWGDHIDAVTSASVILDQPSGSYVVLLNRMRHQKRDTIPQWVSFFGGESEIIMEDISCMIGIQDSAGARMAESYQSRLPENQMKLVSEDGLMMMSRAERGGFDAIVMSEEFAEAYQASTLYGRSDIEVIEVGGGEE